MKLKPILWTLFVVVLVPLALRGCVAMLIHPAPLLAAKDFESPAAPPVANDVKSDDNEEGTASKQPAAILPLPRAPRPEPAKPTIEPSNETPDDNVLPTLERPIRPIRKAEVRVKNVPAQVEIKKAEVVYTESYRLKNQDAARIAEELKKIVPELEIILDPESESINVLQMTPKLREFVTEVIQRLSAARQEPLAPQTRYVPLVGPMTWPPAASSPSLAEAQKRYREAEEQARGHGLGLRSKVPPGQRTPDELQSLKNSVTTAFDARQALLRQELDNFRSRLDRLAKTLEARQRDKNAIIQRRVEELLNPNLNWDATGEPPLVGRDSNRPTSGRSTNPFDGGNTPPPNIGTPRTDSGYELPKTDSSNLPRMDSGLNRAPPTSTLRPGLGLPGSDTNPGLPRDESSLNRPQSANETAKQALIRAAEARRKLADYEFRQAEETLKVVEDQYKAGSVSLTNVLRCRLEVERGKANREIADAELEAAKTGVDIRRTDKPSATLESAAKPGELGDPLAASAEKSVAKIFRLEHAQAESLVKALQDLASEKSFTAKISAEVRSNSVIVFASQDDMRVIEAIIIRLDEAAESSIPKSAPKPGSDSSPAAPASK